MQQVSRWHEVRVIARANNRKPIEMALASSPFEKWIGLDMQCIDHLSLGLDLKILAKTTSAVLKGASAA